EAGILALLKEARGADVRVVDRILWRVHLAGDDIGLFERVERLGATALAAPRAHPLRHELAVVGARLVVLEARVFEPVLRAHNPAPAAEHRRADHGDDDPPVLAMEQIGRAGIEAAVSVAGAVGLYQR